MTAQNEKCRIHIGQASALDSVRVLLHYVHRLVKSERMPHPVELKGYSTILKPTHQA